MRKIFFTLLLLTLPLTCAAQEKCGLTTIDAPEFFGLRLNMTPANVKTVFGKKLKIGVRKQGTFFQNFIKKPPPAFLPGVRALYLRFFDYRLYQIEIFYAGENKTAGFSPQTLAEFVRVLTADKNLPNEFWKNENGKLRLNCAGFSLLADNVLNPRIELTDNILKARFDAEQKRLAEKKN